MVNINQTILVLNLEKLRNCELFLIIMPKNKFTPQNEKNLFIHITPEDIKKTNKYYLPA
jgi:hypothetical protein